MTKLQKLIFFFKFDHAYPDFLQIASSVMQTDSEFIFQVGSS